MMIFKVFIYFVIFATVMVLIGQVNVKKDKFDTVEPKETNVFVLSEIEKLKSNVQELNIKMDALKDILGALNQNKLPFKKAEENAVVEGFHAGNSMEYCSYNNSRGE